VLAVHVAINFIVDRSDRAIAKREKTIGRVGTSESPAIVNLAVLPRREEIAREPHRIGSEADENVASIRFHESAFVMAHGK
jgi:hypothetical protein